MSDEEYYDDRQADAYDRDDYEHDRAVEERLERKPKAPEDRGPDKRRNVDHR